MRWEEPSPGSAPGWLCDLAGVRLEQGKELFSVHLGPWSPPSPATVTAQRGENLGHRIFQGPGLWGRGRERDGAGVGRKGEGEGERCTRPANRGYG